MTRTGEQLRRLLALVAATEPEELDCDEFLQQVGALLELFQAGEEPPPDLAAVAQHLEVCPECREEFDALLRAHEAD